MQRIARPTCREGSLRGPGPRAIWPDPWHHCRNDLALVLLLLAKLHVEAEVEGQASCLLWGGGFWVKCECENAFCWCGAARWAAGWLSVGCVACCTCVACAISLTWAFSFDPSPKRQHHNIFDYRTIGVSCKSSPKMRLNSDYYFT
jgi:hypothetical protein